MELCIFNISNKARIGKNARIHMMTTIGKNIGVSLGTPYIGDCL